MRLIAVVACVAVAFVAALVASPDFFDAIASTLESVASHVGAQPTSSMKVGVGQTAPELSLPDEDGNIVSLSSFKGKSNVVLFFYPKDMTFGCTKQACAFRDSYEQFVEAGAVVLGVSSDDGDSHREFKAKHNLPYHLLVDKDGAARKSWEVPPAMLGIVPGRVTYVIDKAGVVRLMYDSSIHFAQHVVKTLELVRTL